MEKGKKLCENELRGRLSSIMEGYLGRFLGGQEKWLKKLKSVNVDTGKRAEMVASKKVIMGENIKGFVEAVCARIESDEDLEELMKKDSFEKALSEMFNFLLSRDFEEYKGRFEEMIKKKESVTLNLHWRQVCKELEDPDGTKKLFVERMKEKIIQNAPEEQEIIRTRGAHIATLIQEATDNLLENPKTRMVALEVFMKNKCFMGFVAEIREELLKMERGFGEAIETIREELSVLEAALEEEKTGLEENEEGGKIKERGEVVKDLANTMERRQKERNKAQEDCFIDFLKSQAAKDVSEKVEGLLFLLGQEIDFEKINQVMELK
ncbi:MAG: hypothetical protein OEL89_03605, partial [Candidatus Peregrinibacteria bacterium]|nr:hypothetical protein [Candidatus Peregrinibacteria bacterium]